MQQGQNQEQWRVTYYEEGEEPYTEIVTRFSTAWVLSKPYPQLDGLAWVITNKANIRADFEAGQNDICVSWVPVGAGVPTTRTVITRL